MGEWKKVKLGSLIRIKHGYAFPGAGITSDDNGKVLVTPGNFNIGGGFKESGKKFFSGEFPAEYCLSSGDLIVTMTDLSKASDTLGYSAIVPSSSENQYLHNQRIGLVSVVDEIADRNFIYWLMRTPSYHQEVVAGASGTTVKHTSPSRIYDVEVELPDLPTQRRIAAVLGALDDKIEVNRKICENLEAQAQALFKAWFVDFEPFGGKRPEGWKMGKLGDVAAYYDGKIEAAKLTPASYFSTENMLANREGAVDAETVPQSGMVPLCDEGCVLVSNIRPYFKKIIRVNCDGGHSPDVLCFKAKALELQWYLYRMLWDDAFFAYVMSSTKGTKMPRGDKGHIMDYPCVLPLDNDIRKFNDTMASLNGRIEVANRESRDLAAMRDALLPKLMSGELAAEKVEG